MRKRQKKRPLNGFFYSFVQNMKHTPMKKIHKTAILLVFLMTLGQMTMQAQQIKVEASETIELMSIMARTAGYREYHMDMAGKYTEETEAWFAPFESHPAVTYMQSLMAKYGIGYDAVASMSLHIETDGKTVSLIDATTLEKRWKNVNLDTCLMYINQFYTDTRFHEFYAQHQDFYKEGIQAFENNVMQHFHQDWYAGFYGTPPEETFRIIIGFTNGGGCYGPSRQLPGQKKEVFAICGYYLDQETGKAFGNNVSMASILIHEFNHSFVNPRLEEEANKALLEPIGEDLYALTKQLMNWQAYKTATTVLNESIVRAAVIVYLEENGFSAEQIEAEMYDQLGRGFHWMPELVSALKEYTHHRDIYPTFNDFYPEIAKTLGAYVEKEHQRINTALGR